MTPGRTRPNIGSFTLSRGPPRQLIDNDSGETGAVPVPVFAFPFTVSPTLKPIPKMNDKEKSRTMFAFNRYRSRMRWAEKHSNIWTAGMRWYARGRKRLREATEGTTLSVYRLAGVAALLSPMTPWERNIDTAENLAEMYSLRAPYPDLLAEAKRGTVYNNNAESAVSYLSGNDLEAPAGPKTGPFQENLAGDLSPVTIDSHMRDAVNTFDLSSLTGNARRSMIRAVRMCSTLYGIPPAKAQAIIWTVQRDNLGPAR
jgi:hypothetical protein